MRFPGIRPALLALTGLLLAAEAWPAARDPAGRVARIAYVEGAANFAPAGVNEWARAILNRPLIAGDRLWTESGARLELELGGSALRLDQRSAAEILDLDDEVAQFFLSEGRANLYVRRIFERQSYEIATPLAAVVVRSPASLTVEVPPSGAPLRVAVWHGRVEVVGEGRRIELAGPEELIAHDRRLEDHRILRDPVEGEFERFAFERDRELDRAAALRYVPDDLIGYRELDRYGRWEVVRDYGPVWFPSRVSLGWTPYRYGHWVWLPVYGWTWIDDAPWGFAVSHYGRWIWWGGRWGWVPCPRRHRAYWAPALVVFYGGRHWSVGYASAPVGWFPLGPGDIWLPWYSASWDYFRRVNVWNTWIGHGTIVNVYQNIYLRGDLIVNLEYRFRDRDFAWTFVPEENFRRGRPVHRHLLPVGREDVARAELRRVLGVVPTTASLKGDAPAARGLPDEGVFGREAVVSRAPAARAALLPFAEGEASPAVGARERGLRVVGEPIAREGLAAGGASAELGGRGRGRHLGSASGMDASGALLPGEGQRRGAILPSEISERRALRTGGAEPAELRSRGAAVGSAPDAVRGGLPMEDEGPAPRGRLRQDFGEPQRAQSGSLIERRGLLPRREGVDRGWEPETRSPAAEEGRPRGGWEGRSAVGREPAEGSGHRRAGFPELGPRSVEPRRPSALGIEAQDGDAARAPRGLSSWRPASESRGGALRAEPPEATPRWHGEAGGGWRRETLRIPAEPPPPASEGFLAPPAREPRPILRGGEFPGGPQSRERLEPPASGGYRWQEPRPARGGWALGEESARGRSSDAWEPPSSAPVQRDSWSPPPERESRSDEASAPRRERGRGWSDEE